MNVKYLQSSVFKIRILRIFILKLGWSDSRILALFDDFVKLTEVKGFAEYKKFSR